MNVSLFVTCVVDQLFPSVGASTVRLLQRLGCTVDFPQEQTCCGQPAFNSGYVSEARTVARTLLDAFEHSDYVVCPSGSCAGMIHHSYAELFAADPALLARAELLTSKTCELSQFIVNVLGVTDVGATCAQRVTFHPGCHATRLLGVCDEPLALLRAVRNIDLVPLPRSEDCCGFGGTFAIKLADVSGAMAAEKVDHILETKAQIVVGADMGCLMNIAGIIRRRALPIRVMHLAEFLDGAVSGRQR